MSKFSTAVLLCLVAALTAAPAVAGPVDKNPNHNGNGWGSGGKPSVGTPGPVAGAGIALLAAGGAYVLRLRKRKPGSPQR